jgi:hypothetical protein
MIHIGTIEENYAGETKLQNKVRIGWELPTELKVYSEEKGEQPKVIGKEYTLSLNEKSNLRKMLASWRGKDFTEEEAKRFDITVLVGKPCMLNIIHKPSQKDPSIVYEEIGSISPMPKGFACPDPITPPFVLDYENFDTTMFEALPDFIRDKIKKSQEYQNMMHPAESTIGGKSLAEDSEDDLPF